MRRRLLAALALAALLYELDCLWRAVECVERRAHRMEERLDSLSDKFTWAS